MLGLKLIHVNKGGPGVIAVGKVLSQAYVVSLLLLCSMVYVDARYYYEARLHHIFAIEWTTFHIIPKSVHYQQPQSQHISRVNQLDDI